MDIIFLSFVADQRAIDWSFLSGALPRQTSFARASAANYFNSAGFLTQAATDAPRFDYAPDALTAKGLFIEKQGTNLAPNSSMASGYGDGGVSHTLNYGVAPDGSTTSIQLVESATTASHGYNSTGSNVNYVAGQSYTRSYYVRAGTAGFVQIVFNSGPFGSAYCNFDLANKAVGTSIGLTGAITNVCNGWVRISATGTATASATASPGLLYFVQSASSSRLPSYLGTGLTLEIWGSQIEQNAGASSYIATTTTAVTRAADQLSFTVPSGVSSVRFVFDDNSTQDVAVSAGSYVVPTTLNRAWIKRIYSL